MTLDIKTTAILTLDLQQGILHMVPGSDAMMANAERVVAATRSKGFKIIHVGLGFAAGHPEIPETQATFGRIKQSNLFVKGSPSAAFHSSITNPDDLIVYKQRVGAFSENELHLILRSLGIEHLVLFGIATSGIVLSTVRRAFDLDFRCTVLKDACFDADSEVHRVLTEKVFTRQAHVTTVDAFIAELT